jgi:predicted alpha/beta-hydrolase family hydrolase
VSETPRKLTIDVDGAQTSALVYAATEPRRATLVLAHGAGAPQTHPWMVAMARALAERGVDVVTFNFLYTERKKKMVDRAPLLEATWRAVLEVVRTQSDLAKPTFAGGKSMGGRIATQVAAEDGVRFRAQGLALLGYPLHPPGKPEALRDAHLPAVRVPMLFVQGERDAFGTREEMTPLALRLAGSSRGTRLYVVEGGDHSLATRAGAAGAARTGRGGGASGTPFDTIAGEVVRFVASERAPVSA